MGPLATPVIWLKRSYTLCHRLNLAKLPILALHGPAFGREWRGSLRPPASEHLAFAQWESPAGSAPLEQVCLQKRVQLGQDSRDGRSSATARRATIPVSPVESFPHLWKRLWKTGTNSAVDRQTARFIGHFHGANGRKGHQIGVSETTCREMPVGTASHGGESPESAL